MAVAAALLWLLMSRANKPEEGGVRTEPGSVSVPNLANYKSVTSCSCIGFLGARAEKKRKEKKGEGKPLSLGMRQGLKTALASVELPAARAAPPTTYILPPWQ